MELFGFDLNQNGVNYVVRAILHSLKLGDFNLENLAKLVARDCKIEASETLRLIIARIKENFRMRKSPALSFIRLVNQLILKGCSEL